MIEIYTDGSAQPNPGRGGWSAIIVLENGEVLDKYGHDAGPVTNNQMEMVAAIEGLSYFKEPKIIKIYSDSNYLVKGMNIYIKRWMTQGWFTLKGEPIKNRDLWEKLFELRGFHYVLWKHIPGHGTNEHNTRADYIAQQQARTRPIYKLDEKTLEYEKV